jgi:hypothetical protein
MAGELPQWQTGMRKQVLKRRTGLAHGKYPAADSVRPGNVAQQITPAMKTCHDPLQLRH